MSATTKLIAKITQAAREKIFKDMASNAARQKLVEKVAPQVEELAAASTPDTRAWVFGSMANKSGKSHSGNPDLDVMYRTQDPAGQAYPFFYNSQDLHLNRLPNKKELTPEVIEQLRGVVRKGRERYGEDYNWKRILGTAMGLPIYGQEE